MMAGDRLQRSSYGTMRASGLMRLVPRRFRRLLLAALPVVAGAGCTVLSSDDISRIGSRGERLQGIAYALPVGVLDIRLAVSENTAQYFLKVDDPRFFADPTQRNLLRYNPAPQYDDHVEVSVNGKGFLSVISSKSTDQTGNIILAVVDAATQLGGFETDAVEGKAPVQIAEHSINPTAPGAIDRLVRELNDRVLSHARSQIKACDKDDLALSAVARCREYQNIADQVRRWKSHSRDRPPIWIELSRPQAIPSAKPADCSVGVCYRPTLPYRLTTTVGRGQQSRIIELPNEAPLVEIDIRRAFLVEKFQTITFDANGLLKQVTILKPSELLAASTIPLKAVEIVGKTLALRVKVIQNETDLVKSQSDLLAARRSLLDARSQYESAGVGGGSQRMVGSLAPATKPLEAKAIATPPVVSTAAAPRNGNLGTPDLNLGDATPGKR